MREPRIYTDQPLFANSHAQLEEGPSRHLNKVLRLRPEAPLRLFNGDGQEWQATLSVYGKQHATVLVRQQIRSEPAASLQLNLILGISKGDRMDFAIQKAVELGINSILPIFTKRSVVQLEGQRLTRRQEHWQATAISACEQSGRCRLPTIGRATQFAASLGTSSADLRLLLHHQGPGGLNSLPRPELGIDLLIGPEGGLAPQEVSAAESAGFIPVRMGPRIMRTETAPLAALAAIQMLWGDFRCKKTKGNTDL